MYLLITGSVGPVNQAESSPRNVLQKLLWGGDKKNAASTEVCKRQPFGTEHFHVFLHKFTAYVLHFNSYVYIFDHNLQGKQDLPLLIDDTKARSRSHLSWVWVCEPCDTSVTACEYADKRRLGRYLW